MNNPPRILLALLFALTLFLAPSRAISPSPQRTAEEWVASADGKLTTWWISGGDKLEIASKRNEGESNAAFLNRHENMVARGLYAFPQEFGTFIVTEWTGASVHHVASESLLGHWGDVEFWYDTDPSTPSALEGLLELHL